MTRRVIVTAEKILIARAKNWEYYFDLHRKALTYPPEAVDRVLRACIKMPEPKVTLTGSLNEWEYNSASLVPFHKQVDILRLSGLRVEESELLVKWYWTEGLWRSLYVAQFNALPYPDPLYEMQFVDAYPRWISITTPTTSESWLIDATEMRNQDKKKNKKKKDKPQVEKEEDDDD